MKLSTGKVAFPIEFDNGDKECIYFNPNDPELFIRFSDFEKKAEERLKDIEDIKLNDDGTPVIQDMLEAFGKINKVIYEELDIAFDSKVSDVVFKHCSPFAVVGGKYFFVRFIEAIKPEIEKQNKKANAEMQKKMSKYIGKYAK